MPLLFGAYVTPHAADMARYYAMLSLLLLLLLCAAEGDAVIADTHV